MKISRKILPAFAMLVISAVMLSTASFAWFAVSSEAKATGMAVGVKSDSAFLVIDNDINGANIDSNYSEFSVSFTEDAASTTNLIAPTAFDASKMPVVGANYAQTVYNHMTTAPGTDDGTSTPWYTHTGESVSDGSISDADPNATYIPRTVAGLQTYVKVYTVWLAVAQGTSGLTMDNVKPSVTINGSPAVSVLIVGPDGYAHFSNEEDGASTNLPLVECTDLGVDVPDGVIDKNIDSNKVRVDIYVYYNGHHGTITTSNLFENAIKNTDIEVKFSTGETVSSGT